MSYPIIKVENISKAYRIGLKEQQHDTLSAAMASWAKSPLRNFRKLKSLAKFNDLNDPDIFWALNDINFEVNNGEVLGIIGKNGAGKSTLLKIMSRITEPTSGKIEIYGRVASLLEVGTGFNAELTGRENVYLNGTILGMTKREIDKKFDEIVNFSGIEKFIDTPVKRYSSGMKVRLAFAVAAHLDPEILLIDEVLAVGDAEFQKKSLGKINDLSKHEGRTALFVSHDMGAIRNLATRLITLKDGEICFSGETSQGIDAYLKSTESTNGNINQKYIDKFGRYKVEITSVIFNEGNVLLPLKDLKIEIDLISDTLLKDIAINFTISELFNSSKYLISSSNKPHYNYNLTINPGHNKIVIKIPCLPLCSGRYYLGFGLGIAYREKFFFNKEFAVFEVGIDNYPFGTIPTISENGLFLTENNIYIE
jgi:lipopolysaccharide transport system ATP-binding protein